MQPSGESAATFLPDTAQSRGGLCWEWHSLELGLPAAWKGCPGGVLGKPARAMNGIFLLHKQTRTRVGGSCARVDAPKCPMRGGCPRTPPRCHLSLHPLPPRVPIPLSPRDPTPLSLPAQGTPATPPSAHYVPESRATPQPWLQPKD